MRGIIVVGLVAVAVLVIRPWEGARGATDGIGSSAVVVADRGSDPARTPARDASVAGGRPGGGEVRQSDGSVSTTAPPAAAPALSGYRWPTTDARITNNYGLGRPSSFLVDGRPFHDGIDISSFCGARITAAHDGTVLGVGRHTEALLGWIGDLAPMRAKLDKEHGWGTQAIAVVVDDGNGYRSVYAHLGLTTVKVGATIHAGDQIGWEGASGNATGCHLHYAIFSPTETATLALDPKIAKKSTLPPLEITRIDPLSVLPPLAAASIVWGWGAR
jgi:murein DD-endopeptidase MepM/ murein hydrolase activator NlpD